MNSIPQETWDRLGVSRESVARLEVLAGTLGAWQQRINLVAPSTVDDLWHRHILDAAQLLPLLPRGTRAIADLGSGGGFPALVLAAIQPATVHMFEANAKKAAFLQEALRQMKVQGHVHRQRLEQGVAPKGMPIVQVVTARAFAPLEELLGYAEPFFRAGAIGLFHKGQDVDAELTQAAKSWKISAQKHSSLTDSKAVILDVKEISHVDGN
ncbi:MAG: 16S rRNA (guanine(527)-N(7))-methyltransferase RsmG [Alphaproteobacteria bacterium]|nr:16S rRNA (guanine(527)-N(7))-methyltransferase RsmG [Alphaproteobacteria bacterium]